MRFISLTKSFKRFICVSIIFFSFVVSVQAQTGLVGYWNFDEGTGTTITDISGNGFDGTKTGGAYVSSTAFSGAGTALDFQASYVEVADDVLFDDLQVNMTIEAWIYQTDDNNNTIIDRGNYNFTFQAKSNGNPGMAFNNGSEWTYSSATIETNQWVHVAMTWNGATKTVKFYKNGVVTDEITRSNSLTFSAGPINIGRQAPNSCNCNTMDGQLDEVRLWKVMRTDAEILDNYNKKIAIVDQVSAADLASLTTTAGAFTQSFEPGIVEYGVDNVNNATTSITVTPTKSDVNATIQLRLNAGSYADLDSGAASDPLALIVGANTVDVKVIAPDGITIRIYTITVTREIAYPSYVVSGAGTAAVNGVYTYAGKNSSGFDVWQYSSYYLTSDSNYAWISNSSSNDYNWQYYYGAYGEPDPLNWNMSGYYGSPPNPIIELAAPKVTYASSTFIENSANDGAVTGTTTITHNNYESATFTGTDSEDFVTSGKVVVTGVPAGLTAVITRDNNLQLTFSLTGNASAHANANDISNLTIIFQDAAFSDSDAVNTTNFSTNLSINFIEQINVGSGETYTTIQSAVNAAGNGDILLLAAETFTEQNIAIANKSLSIIGVSPTSTIVQAHAVAGSATDRVFNITNGSYAEANQNTFEKLTIRHGNVARKAGGLYAQNTTLRLKDCSIESNNTTTPVDAGYYGDGGGGIQLENSNLISENCTFYDNHHISSYKSDMMGGGAIAFFPNDQVNYMEITNCTFSGNSSGAHGGAIMNKPTITNDISITNSTFVGNSAQYGGAYMQMGSGANPQPIYLTNSLFYGNSAPLGGSQMYSQQATNWTVNNCLIEDTSAGGLAGVYTDCIVGQDPLLGTLTDNGGFTKTISIGAGSPAINSGTTTSLLLDQREFSIVGNRDIGAYEYGGAIPLSGDADLSDLTTTAGVLSPTFAKGTIAYTTANVNSSITSITVTPTQSDANATIEVQANGTGYATVTTATASSALALSVGANTVEVKVTAADGSASKTYTITITVTNTPPTFTSTAVTSVNQGDTYSYTIITNDIDENAVSVTATTKPSWLTINSNVEVSTFAGSSYGFVDGTGTAAQFKNPTGIAVDDSGNVYVADVSNHKIRKITPAGVVTTFAGSSAGFADGTGTAAQFNNPANVALDASGNVYVVDSGNSKIRKITPEGVVSTFAGSSAGFADGTGTSAQFSNPQGITIDASGNVYIADTSNQKIRKITPTGVVTTFAGSDYGDVDGTGTSAQFKYPYGVAVDASGNVYVADRSNHKIRKITPAGVVSTFAGSSSGFANGTGTAAQFKYPHGIAVDASGNVYVADTNNQKIRKITPIGDVSTFAGSTAGYADGTGTSAQFSSPQGITIDASGNVYVADHTNQKIRKITTTGAILLTGDTTGQVGDHNVVLDANDGNGATVQQSFTINIVLAVLSKNGGISFTNPNYVNKNGAVNTSFGLSANGALIAVKD
jgi:ATP-dependent protease HslVU (ClpYQ) peptidase subunit